MNNSFWKYQNEFNALIDIKYLKKMLIFFIYFLLMRTKFNFYQKFNFNYYYKYNINSSIRLTREIKPSLAGSLAWNLTSNLKIKFKRYIV